MGNKSVLTKNYFIYPETVSEYGAEIERVMTETDRAMEEASEIIAKMASVTERIPSQIRSGELLELCETAQAEIRSFDFLSYGKRVNQGLLNLLDQNQYITENFIKKMEATTERMREFGAGCRRLTELIDYSGGSLPLKGLALSAVSNVEGESTGGEEDGEGSAQKWEDILPCAGVEAELQINTEEVMVIYGEKILTNFMVNYGIGNNKEIKDFINWITGRRPDLLQQLYDSDSSNDKGVVLDEIFNEIAIAQKEQENIAAYIGIYDGYRMNMAIGILEEHLAQVGNGKFVEFIEFSDPNTWDDIEAVLQRDYKGLLINLYETQGDEGKAGVFVQLMRKYMRSVDYIFEHISEEDVDSIAQMQSLPTYDLLARMIYQEDHEPTGGRQNNVLWATINRYFIGEGFTNRKESTIRNILLEGKYQSIDEITTLKYDAYHPDYDSAGWRNAKLLAAILYSQIGEECSDKVDEDDVRNAILSSCDINGDYISNTIGNCNSFYTERDENGNYYNYFYEMK